MSDAQATLLRAAGASHELPRSERISAGRLAAGAAWTSASRDQEMPVRAFRTYRVLIADPDDETRRQLATSLAVTGEFVTEEASTGEVARQLVDQRYFNALLIDVELPDLDGRKLCRLLRAQLFGPPIIIMGQSAADGDVILSLELGANDYVVKPFRTGVLLARLHSHLRSFDKTDEACFEVGVYLFNPARRLLRSMTGADELYLTVTESQILRYLLQHSYTAVDYSTIVREALGSRSRASTTALHTFIYRLRRKIEEDPEKPRIILSVYRGYMLCPQGMAT
jgi:DNA-binding response OmpR family regulator